MIETSAVLAAVIPSVQPISTADQIVLAVSLGLILLEAAAIVRLLQLRRRRRARHASQAKVM